MSEELVTLERIRALAQCIIDDSAAMVAEVGEAGARDDRAKAEVARRVIQALDGKPDDVDAKPLPRPRVPILVVTTLDDYARSGIVPPLVLRYMLEGDLFSAVTLAEHTAHLSDEMGDVLANFAAIAVHIRETLHPTVFGSPEAVSRWIARRRA